MYRDQFRFEIRINGKSIREYLCRGETWVEGRKGSVFSLRAINGSAGRVLAIMSIDGLSVMDGEGASLDSNGYIIEQGQILDIPGWRLDNSNVAQFRFHKPHNSYAAKTGNPLNIGVIGCAMFSEKTPKWHPQSVMFRTTGGEGLYKGGSGSTQTLGAENRREAVYSSNVSADDVSVDQSAQMDWMGIDSVTYDATQHVSKSPSLGTEFGKQVEHKVTEVPFEKEEKPSAVFEIRYGTREDLKGRGINLDPRPAAGRPNAFPEEKKGCTPPEGWSGK